MTPADLKREITQMIEQGDRLMTKMHQFQTEVQQNTVDLSGPSARMEQVIEAGERSYWQIQRIVGLMSNLYLFEIESLVQDAGIGLTPEQQQQLLALKDGLSDIRTELAVENMERSQPDDIAQGTLPAEAAQRTERLDRSSSPREPHPHDVLVILIRHGSKGKPPDDDRTAKAVQRVRESCRLGAEGESKWPFPPDWKWATWDGDQRARAVTDLLTPLNPEGEDQTNRCASLLCPLIDPLDLSSTVFLSSYYRHAQEMANSLGSQCSVGGIKPRFQPLRSLTPNSQAETLEDILLEAQQQGIDLLPQRLVVCVGHEARLSHLYTRLTGKRTRPFNHADVVGVSAKTWADLRAGNGRQKFRLPVADPQEEALRSKVQSKMTVATFLAGFAAAVLFDLLLTGMVSPLRQVAGILITTSLALFVAVVYMYDRLSMPEGFWVDEERPDRSRRRPGGRGFQRDVEQQGPLYAHMVWTWTFVFTPAVILALLGFLVLVVGLENLWLLIAMVAALAAVWLYYFACRPRLGTD
jgi:phosphohistidine phosphatase SixA